MYSEGKGFCVWVVRFWRVQALAAREADPLLLPFVCHVFSPPPLCPACFHSSGPDKGVAFNPFPLPLPPKSAIIPILGQIRHRQRPRLSTIGRRPPTGGEDAVNLLETAIRLARLPAQLQPIDRIAVLVPGRVRRRRGGVHPAGRDGGASVQREDGRRGVAKIVVPAFAFGHVLVEEGAKLFLGHFE